tara:strand:+ start:106 stop:276 length:171 start_codon:yes stop_codon:yes gene_type:complete
VNYGTHRRRLKAEFRDTIEEALRLIAWRRENFGDTKAGILPINDEKISIGTTNVSA